MTLRKLIANTTADSSPSWTTQSITFIAGWWRSLPTAILPCSANTPTPRPANRAKRNATHTIVHRALALGLCAASSVGAQHPPQAGAPISQASTISPSSLSSSPVPQSTATVRNVSTTPQDTPHKKKKAAKPKSPACLTGCKPDTTAPALDAATPEDAAVQKELALLARDVHLGIPGSYEKLASFANKNSASVWTTRRPRAALRGILPRPCTASPCLA